MTERIEEGDWVRLDHPFLTEGKEICEVVKILPSLNIVEVEIPEKRTVQCLSREEYQKVPALERKIREVSDRIMP